MPQTHFAFQLCQRDQEIILTLTRKIRVITAHQAKRTWWPDSGYGTAQLRLQTLADADVVCTFQVRAHPELLLASPICSWCPGDPAPPFGVISYRLRSRWSEPLRTLTVYTASTRSARRYGGHGGRHPRPLQMTHDLHFSAIYLRLLQEDPGQAAGWVSESALTSLRRGQKIPDAEIHTPEGIPTKVIEFGGSYPPERLRRVHEDCERRQIPYEIW